MDSDWLTLIFRSETIFRVVSDCIYNIQQLAVWLLWQSLCSIVQVDPSQQLLVNLLKIKKTFVDE